MTDVRLRATATLISIRLPVATVRPETVVLTHPRHDESRIGTDEVRRRRAATTNLFASTFLGLLAVRAGIGVAQTWLTS